MAEARNARSESFLTKPNPMVCLCHQPEAQPEAPLCHRPEAQLFLIHTPRPLESMY